MARPRNRSDHVVVQVESSAFGRTGLQTKIDFKAIRYIFDDKVYWEVRHVLGDFYGESQELDVAFETSKIIKKQFDGIKSMLEELGLNLWSVLVPSRKAFEMKKTFYIASDVDPDKVQDEYYISTLGLIVWLCVVVFTTNRR
jgi:hypothetical protein